jgi:outer membrane lipopolysaccharide assembly protein LptE/RlpB
MADQFNAATSPYSSNATQQLSNDNQREQIYNNLKHQVANNIILQLQSIDPSVYEVKKHD